MMVDPVTFVMSHFRRVSFTCRSNSRFIEVCSKKNLNKFISVLRGQTFPGIDKLFNHLSKKAFYLYLHNKRWDMQGHVNYK